MYKPPFNPLVYPAGIQPGFDPTHVASSSQLMVSLVALGNGNVLTNILTGQAATAVGTPAAVTTGFGPAINFPSGAANYNTVGGQSTATVTVLTCAAILMLNATPSFGIVGQDNTVNTAPNNLMIVSGVLNIEHAATLTSSGLPALTVGVPWFVIASGSAAGYHFLQMNMLTGAIQTASVAGSGFTTSSATWAFGCNSTAGDSLNGKMAAVTLIKNGLLLSLSQMQIWATDPWGFWFPRRGYGPDMWTQIGGKIATFPPLWWSRIANDVAVIQKFNFIG